MTQAPMSSPLLQAANRLSAPPMQNPTTPTGLPVRPRRCATAPRRSFSAWPMLRAMSSFPASSGDLVTVPWYRSGASAVNPARAKRSVTSWMWSFSPQYSWMTITPLPGPALSGCARYPSVVPPSAAKLTFWPIRGLPLLVLGLRLLPQRLQLAERVGAHVHGAELRPAHAAEGRGLVALGGQRLVVHAAGSVRVQRQPELLVPVESEPGAAERVVPVPRPAAVPRHVRGVGRDLVGDHALLHVLRVGPAQVLLGLDVAEHGRARGPRRGGADGGRDVIVSGSDVGHERTQDVERGLVALLDLALHVHGDLVEGDVAGPLHHHLHVLLPGLARQL